MLSAGGGFIRVFITSWSVADALAIASSLWLIVMASVTVGSGLPFGLAKAGVDPANAGTTIQVRCRWLSCEAYVAVSKG